MVILELIGNSRFRSSARLPLAMRAVANTQAVAQASELLERRLGLGLVGAEALAEGRVAVESGFPIHGTRVEAQLQLSQHVFSFLFAVADTFPSVRDGVAPVKEGSVQRVSRSLRNYLWVYCPGHAGAKGNDRADRLAGKATLTSGLLLGRF